MAVDLASLAIRVESLEAKQAAGNLDRLSRSGKRAEGTMGGLSRAAKGLIGVFGGLLVARQIGRAFAEASEKAKKFEASVSELSAITGLTGAKLDIISKKAAEFGRTTTLSATQAAEAFKLVASTQPQLLALPNQLAKVTEAAIVLAEATGSTLPDAADTVGQSLNQFGLDAEEAERVINVLAAGAQKGASFVNETAEALKYAGTVAASVGVSFESTNSAIQRLSTVGIKASEAGTALRNIFLKLEGQTNTQFKPSIVGFEQALQNLQDSQISLTEQTELFGLRSVVAANALINQAGEVATLTEALTDQDTAYEQQKTKVDNLEGAIKGLRSAQEGLQIRIGAEMNPTLRTLTETLTDATNAFTDFMGEAEDDDGLGILDFALKGAIKLVFRLGVEFTDLGDLIGSWAAQVGQSFGAVGSAFKALGIIVVSFFDTAGTYFQEIGVRFMDLVDATAAFAAALKANLTLDFDLADQIMLARMETAAATDAELAALQKKREMISGVREEVISTAAAEIQQASDNFDAIGEERRARREMLDEEIEAFNSKVDFGTKANKVATEGVEITREQNAATEEQLRLQKEAEEFAARQAEIQSNQTELDEVSDPYQTDLEAAEKHAAEQLAILERLGADSVNLTEEQEQQRLETILRVNEELAAARQTAFDEEKRMAEEKAIFERELALIAAEEGMERAEAAVELEQEQHELRLERMIEQAEDMKVAQELIDKARQQMEEKHQQKLQAIREKYGKKENAYVAGGFEGQVGSRWRAESNAGRGAAFQDDVQGQQGAGACERRGNAAVGCREGNRKRRWPAVGCDSRCDYAGGRPRADSGDSLDELRRRRWRYNAEPRRIDADV